MASSGDIVVLRDAFDSYYSNILANLEVLYDNVESAKNCFADNLGSTSDDTIKSKFSKVSTDISNLMRVINVEISVIKNNCDAIFNVRKDAEVDAARGISLEEIM